MQMQDINLEILTIYRFHILTCMILHYACLGLYSVAFEVPGSVSICRDSSNDRYHAI